MPFWEENCVSSWDCAARQRPSMYLLSLEITPIGVAKGPKSTTAVLDGTVIRR